MAEGDDSAHQRARRLSGSDDSEADTDAIALDLVNLMSDRSKCVPPNLSSTSGAQDVVKKEENPFSFRHFLNPADRSYQNQGARPKVYCEGRPVSVPSASPDTASGDKHISMRMVNDYPAALPDFVQDHLVIEQCYLNKNGNYHTDMNLPDFALERNRNSRPADNNEHKIQFRPQAEFPLDLPISSETQMVRNSPQPSIAEVGNSISLPDFLADGAVRNQDAEVANTSPEWETDRLRMELENTRRLLMEQTRRGDYLAQELEIARNNEHEYTQKLAKALEQVEENLERSKIRTSSSESSIKKLRQQVKVLNKEIDRLKGENESLRSGCSTSGRSDAQHNLHVAHKELALDLRYAATTAEQSLKQLLSGVENLRLLANRVEHLSRNEEQSVFNSDDDIDDDEEDVGPAL